MKKKALIIINNDIGLYNFRKEVVEELLKSNYNVCISVPCSTKSNYFRELGCKVFDTKIDRRGLNPMKDLKLFIAYLSILRKEKPDIVLSYTIKPNIYGGIACSLNKIPYITTITGLGTSIENASWLSNIICFLYKIALKKSKMVFFQNNSNKDFMIQKKIVKNNYCLVPGSGINLAEHEFEKYPQNESRIRFVFIGRIMQDKGIDELIESAKFIKNKYAHVSFDIVGMFDDLKYKEIFEILQKEEIVRYHGFQENCDLFIKQAHALILPSYHEGLSNVLLEAQACGRPVLATKVPGCMETFEEGITGFGCDVKSVESLIGVIEKFINLEYNKKVEMGLAARKRIEQKFDRAIVVDQYMQEINTAFRNGD